MIVCMAPLQLHVDRIVTKSVLLAAGFISGWFARIVAINLFFKNCYLIGIKQSEQIFTLIELP